MDGKQNTNEKESIHVFVPFTSMKDLCNCFTLYLLHFIYHIKFRNEFYHTHIYIYYTIHYWQQSNG